MCEKCDIAEVKYWKAMSSAEVEYKKAKRSAWKKLRKVRRANHSEEAREEETRQKAQARASCPVCGGHFLIAEGWRQNPFGILWCGDCHAVLDNGERVAVIGGA
jgi:ribosomal protein L44E